MSNCFIVKKKSLPDYLDKQIDQILAHGVESLYRVFKVPKRSGGGKKFRTICAPEPVLKKVQRELYETIEPFYRRFRNNHSTGFEKNKNCAYNARAHVRFHKCSSTLDWENSRLVINPNRHPDIIHSNIDNTRPKQVVRIDLKDAFGSVPEQRLVETLSRRLGNIFDSEFIVKTTLIAMYKGGLPQGSPLSPLLLNIYLMDFDYTVSALINNKLVDDHSFERGDNIVYTRYADDIVISSDVRNLAKKAIPIVRAAAKQVGMRVNSKKTKIMTIGTGMFITGANIVNSVSHTSISRRSRNRIRAAIYQASQMPNESSEREKARKSICGRIAHVMELDRLHGDTLYQYAVKMRVITANTKICGTSGKNIKLDKKRELRHNNFKRTKYDNHKIENQQNS
jgi:RNA-directed DNA polymerase